MNNIKGQDLSKNYKKKITFYNGVTNIKTKTRTLHGGRTRFGKKEDTEQIKTKIWL